MEHLWDVLKAEAAQQVKREPLLAALFHETILQHRCFQQGLAHCLASKLVGTVNFASLALLMTHAFEDDENIVAAAQADVIAAYDRDPACRNYYVPFLFYKGFLAIQTYRVAHWLWCSERYALALYLQHRASELFAVDIHPAARIGRGILLDHATGFVAGETVVIEDNVSLLHEVTLGGTGKQRGDRHPKVRTGVTVGAGAKILGNVEIGSGAKIGAGSIVVDHVPAARTAVGARAKLVSLRPAIENTFISGDLPRAPASVSL